MGIDCAREEVRAIRRGGSKHAPYLYAAKPAARASIALLSAGFSST